MCAEFLQIENAGHTLLLESAAVFEAVARIHLHAGDYEGAVERARRAISARPGYAYAYVVLAAGVAHLDRQKEAREALANLRARLTRGIWNLSSEF